MQLRQDYSEFQDRNAEVIAIGPDSTGAIQSWWEEEQIPFPGVPDPDKRILNELGQEFKWLKFGRMPAVLVVDQGGVLRSNYYGDSASDIPENSEVLHTLDGLNRAQGL